MIFPVRGHPDDMNDTKPPFIVDMINKEAMDFGFGGRYVAARLLFDAISPIPWTV